VQPEQLTVGNGFARICSDSAPCDMPCFARLTRYSSCIGPHPIAHHCCICLRPHTSAKMFASDRTPVLHLPPIARHCYFFFGLWPHTTATFCLGTTATTGCLSCLSIMGQN
jgi:hypothetical protein